MITASVIGCTGYTGQEIVRILIKHPQVKIATLTARIDKKKSFSDLFPAFKHIAGNLVCEKLNVAKVAKSSDIVFVALPHTISQSVIKKLRKYDVKIIDLSADYRLSEKTFKANYKAKHVDSAGIKEAIYGLTELNRTKISRAKLVANPGCYPTGSLLASVPILKSGKVKSNIIIDAKSGVTGAGRKAHIALLHAEVNENFKAYKLDYHAHKTEIKYHLKKFYNKNADIIFAPHLLPINRGILSTIYFEMVKKVTGSDLVAVYKAFYKDSPFVRILEKGHLPETKNVCMTNYCDIGFAIQDNKIIIVSAIDNLVKGAAGQAVQNMNIMFGLEENAGF